MFFPNLRQHVRFLASVEPIDLRLDRPRVAVQVASHHTLPTFTAARRSAMPRCAGGRPCNQELSKPKQEDSHLTLPTLSDLENPELNRAKRMLGSDGCPPLT